LIHTEAEYLREVHILKIFKKSDTSHHRIVRFIGAIAVGNEFNIFMPVADRDLESLLTETPSKMMQRMSLTNLFREIVGVAGALKHLHRELQTDKTGERILHLDLKPKNILVFDSENEEQKPVGHWRISDFGISELTCDPPRINGSGILDPNGVYPRQFTGTYVSPESFQRRTVDERSDIWAFGCIMVRVIVRGIEGQSGLKRLDDARRRDEYGGGIYDDDCFYRTDMERLNPHIEVWLDLLEYYAGYDRESLKDCKTLLQSIFSIKKEERPNAEGLFYKLNLLRDSFATPGRESPEISSMQADPTQSLIGKIKGGDIAGVRAELLAENNLQLIDDIKSRSGKNSPLVQAITCDESRILRILLYYVPGLQLTGVDKHEPPLAVAARLGKLEMTKILVSAGSLVDATDKLARTPLMLAAQKGHIKVVKFLLDQKADWKMTSKQHISGDSSLGDPEGYTAFHYAVAGEGGPDIIKVFCDFKVDINLPTGGSQETPLHVAARLDKENKIVEPKVTTLIDFKASLDLEDSLGKKPIDIARKLVSKKYLTKILEEAEKEAKMKGSEGKGRKGEGTKSGLLRNVFAKR
jgi:serine/threonine protein kinase